MNWLKNLLGGGRAAPTKKRLPSKSYNPPSNRAALLKEAMAVHQKGRAQAQGVLESALAELAANPPKPSDIAGMTRLLELRRAVLAMKRVADHDGQRARALTGVKELMGVKTKP